MIVQTVSILLSPSYPLCCTSISVWCLRNDVSELEITFLYTSKNWWKCFGHHSSFTRYLPFTVYLQVNWCLNCHCCGLKTRSWKGLFWHHASYMWTCLSTGLLFSNLRIFLYLDAAIAKNIISSSKGHDHSAAVSERKWRNNHTSWPSLSSVLGVNFVSTVVMSCDVLIGSAKVPTAATFWLYRSNFKTFSLRFVCDCALSRFLSFYLHSLRIYFCHLWYSVWCVGGVLFFW